MEKTPMQKIQKIIEENELEKPKRPSKWRRFWSWFYKMNVDESEMKFRMGPLLYLFMFNTVVLLISLGWVIVVKLVNGQKVETPLILGFLGTLTTFTINLVSIFKHKKLSVESQTTIATTPTPTITPTVTPTPTGFDLSSIPIIGPLLAPKQSTTDPKTGKPSQTPTPSTPIIGKDVPANQKVNSGDNT